MGNTRMCSLCVTTALALAAMVLATTVGPAVASPNGSGQPVANLAKKKCKKKNKKKCKKKKQAGGYLEGRYLGHWSGNSANLAFNVFGGRVYTGPFDYFYIDETCYNTNPNYTGPDQVYHESDAIGPVQANIAPDGSFSGTGVYTPGFGQTVPWTLSGKVSGGTATGTFSVNYRNGYNDPCSGAASFTAQWYGDYTL
jgi:hypothetical protein